MLCRPWRWALSLVIITLLLHFQILVTYGQSTEELEQEKKSEQLLLESYLPATVEYALHVFNLDSKDTNGYRLVHILKSWQEPEDSSLIFSMELLLRRTRCGKFEDNIDNCPFETDEELDKTFNCFFTIRTEPWKTLFELHDKICSEIFF